MSQRDGAWTDAEFNGTQTEVCATCGMRVILLTSIQISDEDGEWRGNRGFE